MDFWRSTCHILVICAFLRFCESLKMFQTIRNSTGIVRTEQMHNYSSYEDKNEFFRQKYPVPDDVPVECTKLRQKRWISDGQCYTQAPIIDDVCVGSCLPFKQQDLPWWSELYKYWSKNKVKEYRCVEDRVKRKKLTLYCKDGSIKFYRVKVVKSCKCKVFTKDANRTRRRKHKNKSRRNRKKRQRDRRRHRRHRDRRHRRNKNSKDRKKEKRLKTAVQNT